MSILFVIPVTLLLYFALVRVARYWPHPLLNPVLASILISVLVLAGLNISYLDYSNATAPLSALLEPAIVALALPLYRQAMAIKQRLPVILMAVSLGVCFATLVAFCLSLVLNAPLQLAASFAAPAVTTPITLLVTETVGGIPALAAVMVILIGIFGALCGLGFLRAIKVHDPYAQGLALGTACHAIGTAAALKYQEQAGAFASVALALSALLSALIVPQFYPWLVALVY